MKKFRSVLAVAPFAAAVLFPAAMPASAEKSTVDDVQKEISETSEALRSYANEQKEKALGAAETTMESLDAKIEELQATLDRRWDSMSEDAREEMREAGATLREKRQKVAEWYGAMKHSSADAWTDVRNGFIEAYGAFGESLSKAAGKLESDKNSTN